MKNDLNNMKWKFVDSTKEAVDLYIVNHVKAYDIVVTQDIGLAARLLLKGAYILSPKGISYEEKSIHTALDMRYLSVKTRRKGFMEKDQNLIRMRID
jgi:uncharacterized protein